MATSSQGPVYREYKFVCNRLSRLTTDVFRALSAKPEVIAYRKCTKAELEAAIWDKSDDEFLVQHLSNVTEDDLAAVQKELSLREEGGGFLLTNTLTTAGVIQKRGASGTVLLTHAQRPVRPLAERNADFNLRDLTQKGHHRGEGRENQRNVDADLHLYEVHAANGLHLLGGAAQQVAFPAGSQGAMHTSLLHWSQRDTQAYYGEQLTDINDRSLDEVVMHGRGVPRGLPPSQVEVMKTYGPHIPFTQHDQEYYCPVDIVHKTCRQSNVTEAHILTTHGSGPSQILNTGAFGNHGNHTPPGSGDHCRSTPSDVLEERPRATPDDSAGGRQRKRAAELQEDMVLMVDDEDEDYNIDAASDDGIDEDVDDDADEDDHSAHAAKRLKTLAGRGRGRGRGRGTSGARETSRSARRGAGSGRGRGCGRGGRGNGGGRDGSGGGEEEEVIIVEQAEDGRTRGAGYTVQEALAIADVHLTFTKWKASFPCHKKPSIALQVKKFHQLAGVYDCLADRTEELWNKKKNMVAAFKAVYDEAHRTGASGVLYWDLEDEEEQETCWRRFNGKVTLDFTKQVYEKFFPELSNRPAVTATAGGAVDLAADHEDDRSNNAGAGGKGVGGVVGVGVLPEGSHSGRIKMSGKPGGTGMAMLEVLTKLADRKDNPLQTISASMGELSNGIKAITRMAASFEEENKHKAKVSAAKEQHLHAQTVREKIEAIKVLREMGGISMEMAQQACAELTVSLLSAGKAVLTGQNAVEEQQAGGHQAGGREEAGQRSGDD